MLIWSKSKQWPGPCNFITSNLGHCAVMNVPALEEGQRGRQPLHGCRSMLATGGQKTDAQPVTDTRRKPLPPGVKFDEYYSERAIDSRN